MTRTFERRCLLAFAALALVVGVGAPVARAEDELTVTDLGLLEWLFSESEGTAEMSLKLGGNWIPTPGNVVDEISWENPATIVTARFQPESGHEHRMRFRPDGSSTWGPWTAWTGNRISHTLSVPAAGATNTDSYEAESKPTGGSPTIAVSGYIRVKKLNS